MDGFPSGQRGQTVNLLQIASVVRIHLHPFEIYDADFSICIDEVNGTAHVRMSMHSTIMHIAVSAGVAE